MLKNSAKTGYESFYMQLWFTARTGKRALGSDYIIMTLGFLYRKLRSSIENSYKIY